MKNPQQAWSQPAGEAASELVSAMMDGELQHQESMAFLARIKSSPESRDDWRIYHLIGDVMRQLPPLSEGFEQRLAQQLADEPTVLSPKRSAIMKHPLIALSAAASVALITVVAWQFSESPPAQNATAQLAEVRNTTNRNISLAALSDPQSRRNVNEYLIVHQEYSPAISMQGVAPYVRTVYETQGETAR